MKNITIRMKSGLIALLSVMAILYGCVPDPVLWDLNSKDQVISDYIVSHPDEYSEFGKLTESTGLNSLLSTRGRFTLFIPTNEAMLKYYKDNNTSFEQLSMADRKKLVYNHLLASEISSKDFGLGALRDTNALGDYIVTEFTFENDKSEILINKQAIIIDRDIIAANGVIQKIDKVLDIVQLSVYELLKKDDNYKLFTAGIEAVGLDKTLDSISYVYGKKKGVKQYARSRFTILAVTDKVFADSLGVTNINDLIAKFTNRPDSVKFIQNAFYRYMEYHCLAGTYYLSDFTSRLYPILSFDNNVSFNLDQVDYKINLDKKSKRYIGFVTAENDKTIYPDCNVSGKNGSIHRINSLLPVMDPDPELFIFDTTDYLDVKSGDYYGKYYARWVDGENTFNKIKWKGEFLQYYYKNHNAPTQVNSDCLQMFGYWDCTITTPKVMKGSYKLSGYLWSDQTRNYNVYVDGVYSVTIKGADPDRPPWGEFTWTETKEHTIRVTNITPGLMFWDTVIFTPIK